MNEWVKTAGAVALAAGMVTLALFVNERGIDSAPEELDDVGQLFYADLSELRDLAENAALGRQRSLDAFASYLNETAAVPPGFVREKLQEVRKTVAAGTTEKTVGAAEDLMAFVDANPATALEVVEYDASTGEPKAFKVQYQDGVWTLPSSEGYPADAQDQLRQTAGGITGLRKDAIASTDKAKHADFGVLDPRETGAGVREGTGKRVIMTDAKQRVLADLIVGKEVEDQPDQRYVRVPGSDRVYQVVVSDLNVSSRFTDWIDTDVLELEATAVESVTFRDFTLDASRGVLTPGDDYSLAKDDQNQWQLADVPEGKQTDAAKSRRVIDKLASLAITDVRKKEGFSPQLKVIDAQVMARLGFYALADGSVAAPAGEHVVRAGGGLVYTIRYGNTFVPDQAAGSEDPSAIEQSRYMLVAVDFDDAAFPEPPTVDEQLAAKEAAAKEAEEAAAKEADNKNQETPPADGADGEDAANQNQETTPADAADSENTAKEAADDGPGDGADDAADTDADGSTQEGAAANVDAAKTDDGGTQEEAADGTGAADDAVAANAADEAKAADQTDETKGAEDPERAAVRTRLEREREAAMRQRQTRIDAARKRVDELAEFYAGWYYVISNADYNAVAVKKADLLTDPKPSAAPGLPQPGAPAGMPQPSGVRPPIVEQPPTTPAPASDTPPAAPAAAAPAAAATDEPVEPKPGTRSPAAPMPDAVKPDAPATAPKPASPDEPKPDAPKTDPPKADEPKADAPVPAEPKPTEPGTNTPKPDTPKADPPNPDEPKSDGPKSDKPKPDAPKDDSPEPEEPKLAVRDAGTTALLG